MTPIEQTDPDLQRQIAEETPEDAFKCPTCKGRGTVNPLTAPQGFFCVSTTDCPSCDGTGEF